MSGSNIKKSQPENSPSSLDGQTVREFIKVQHQQAQNEAKELEIKAKEVDNSYKFAMKSLELQADIHKSRPDHVRKWIKTVANYGILSFIIFLLFCGVCLHYGYVDFLYKFLQGIGYIVTTVMGYFLGKKRSSTSDKDNGNDNIQVVE